MINPQHKLNIEAWLIQWQLWVEQYEIISCIVNGLNRQKQCAHIRPISSGCHDDFLFCGQLGKSTKVLVHQPDMLSSSYVEKIF